MVKEPEETKFDIDIRKNLYASVVLTGDTACSDRLPERHGDWLTGGEPRGDLLVGGKPGDSGMMKESSNLDVSDVKVTDDQGKGHHHEGANLDLGKTDWSGSGTTAGVVRFLRGILAS